MLAAAAARPQFAKRIGAVSAANGGFSRSEKHGRTAGFDECARACERRARRSLAALRLFGEEI